MSIRKRGKTWTVVIELGKDENGKRKQKTFGGFKTKKQATEFQNEFCYHNFKSLNFINITVGELLEFWLEHYVKPELRNTTYNGYCVNVYNHIMPYISNIKAIELKPYHINNLYEQLKQKGLSSTSVLYVHNCLKGAFSYAMRNDIINNNVMYKVTAPKKCKIDYKVLSKSELIRLLKCAEDTDIYLPVALAVYLGLRRGEILALTWDCFNLENNTLHIKASAQRVNGVMQFCDTKNISSNRYLSLPYNLRLLLIEEKNRQARQKYIFGDGYNINNLICCNYCGDWITTNYLDKKFKKLLVDNNFLLVHLHDIRRSIATILLEEGQSSKVIANMLGHSSTRVTDLVYLQMTSKLSLDCAEFINTLFN